MRGGKPPLNANDERAAHRGDLSAKAPENPLGHRGDPLR